jgi:hypothetical protein
VPTVRILIGKLSVSCRPEDEPTARVIAGACEEALQLAKVCWGLEAPSECRLYVMTTWRQFVFQSAPWAWRIMLALSYPLWSERVRRTWPMSAGWTQHFGRRIAIGIKPPRLLEISDKSIGRHLFVEEADPIAKIRQLTCHELIHAASVHLALPAWLNEGLAALSVDRFVGKSTIRTDSLYLVQRSRPKAAPPSYRAMARRRGEELAYHVVRGYWIVRYLDETYPGFLRRLLATRRSQQAIERAVAGQLGMQPAQLWTDIDDRIVKHFGRGKSRGVPD